eukprot:CAMPEP_0113848922 /NCGR_PEP_ID=MMETSP0372-20130328/2783_1 /TAXON_ID=340204 /ORGANISM="Lankesteria abbotti" /LENGTH=62 /DNA_ID=CAMNT_0000818533 /DNA_START=623 /DNA_END=807 /DNA_ORIENTATION=- /assembly_acc=CAM_ASM_000359
MTYTTNDRSQCTKCAACPAALPRRSKLLPGQTENFVTTIVAQFVPGCLSNLDTNTPPHPIVV